MAAKFAPGFSRAEPSIYLHHPTSAGSVLIPWLRPCPAGRLTRAARNAGSDLPGGASRRAFSTAEPPNPVLHALARFLRCECGER